MNAPAGPALPLSETAVRHLARTRFWAKWIGVWCVVTASVTGLMLVAMVGVLVVAGQWNMAQPSSLYWFPVAALGVASGLAVAFSLLAFRLGRGLAVFAAGGSDGLVTAAHSMRLLCVLGAIAWLLTVLYSAAKMLAERADVPVPMF
jgi:hypothetical protein